MDEFSSSDEALGVVAELEAEEAEGAVESEDEGVAGFEVEGVEVKDDSVLEPGVGGVPFAGCEGGGGALAEGCVSCCACWLVSGPGVPLAMHLMVLRRSCVAGRAMGMRRVTRPEVALARRQAPICTGCRVRGG